MGTKKHAGYLVIYTLASAQSIIHRGAKYFELTVNV